LADKGSGGPKRSAKTGKRPVVRQQQYELFPQHDRCPACGGRLTTKIDGFGRAYELCGKCKRRTYLQR